MVKSFKGVPIFSGKTGHNTRRPEQISRPHLDTVEHGV